MARSPSSPVPRTASASRLRSASSPKARVSRCSIVTAMRWRGGGARRGAHAVRTRRHFTASRDRRRDGGRACQVGRVDILVNNAMAYTEGSVIDTTDEAWAATIDIGLTAVFRLCRAVLPVMTRQQHGCIVNIASINQIVANPGLAAYTSAKGGLQALTKQIAVEYGPQGIRCNALSPGLVLTERERAQAGQNNGVSMPNAIRLAARGRRTMSPPRRCTWHRMKRRSLPGWTCQSMVD